MSKNKKELTHLEIAIGAFLLVFNIIFIVLLLANANLPSLSDIFTADISLDDSLYNSKNFFKCVLLSSLLLIIWYIAAKGFIIFVDVIFYHSPQKKIRNILIILYTITIIVIFAFKIKDWDKFSIYFLLLPFVILLLATEFFKKYRYQDSLIGLLIFSLHTLFINMATWLFNVKTILGIIFLFLPLVIIGFIVSNKTSGNSGKTSSYNPPRYPSGKGDNDDREKSRYRYVSVDVNGSYKNGRTDSFGLDVYDYDYTVTFTYENGYGQTQTRTAYGCFTGVTLNSVTIRDVEYRHSNYSCDL